MLPCFPLAAFFKSVQQGVRHPRSEEAVRCCVLHVGIPTCFETCFSATPAVHLSRAVFVGCDASLAPLTSHRPVGVS